MPENRWFILGVLFVARFALGFQFQSAGSVSPFIVVAVTGMAITVIIGVLIPYTALPLLTFAMFGIAYAIAVPIIAALPVEVLKPENRGPGLGVYYIWYYAGSAFLPVAGGLLQDLTGQAATSILFGAGMMLACLMLLALFRREQARLPL